jgi:hypothetical protein
MFIASAATALLAIPPAPFAQQQDKIWRIGVFYFGSRQSSLDSGRYNAFVQGMRELGYVDGIEHLLVADPAQLTEVSCYVQ